MKDFNLLNVKEIYFIGIGGVSTSALAKYCKMLGIKVSGSDKKISSKTIELEKVGISVNIGHKKENLKKADCVCYTSAISENNEEYLEAKRRGLTLVKRSELLGAIAREYKTTIAISGSHGKTTTTSILADILILANKSPTVFLGGENKNFGNLYCESPLEKNVILVEACEYKKNFLDITPNISVVLNIDNDHLDSYKNLEEQVLVVEKFISPSISFVNFDDIYAKKVVGDKIVKVGLDCDYPITAKNIAQKIGYQYFSVYYYGKRLGRIKTRLKGKHNIYNCLFAISVALELKIPFCFIKKAIEEFKGVSRRDEYIGEFMNKKVFIDYAHHPKELESLVESIIDIENTILVFQPHTYSRTKFLMADFIKVLSNAKGEVVIYKTYPAREKYDRNSSALALFRKLSKVKNARYFKSKKGLIEYLEKVEKGKNIYLVGAGDVYEIAKILTTRKKLEKSGKKSLQKN